MKKPRYEAVTVTQAGNYTCGHHHRTAENADVYCGRDSTYIREVYDGSGDTPDGQRAIAEDRAGDWMRSL